MKKVYVWYSSATDVTGKAIQDKLGCQGGLKKPEGEDLTVLCWGTKNEKDVNLGVKKKILNHPNHIRRNRNKYSALQKLNEAKVNVAAFTDSAAKVGTKGLEFPIVARKSFHQGGAGFWLCLNSDHVAQAVKEGAQYFQKYINVHTEYRLHVVDGKIIHAVKKTPRENLKEAFVAHYTDYIKAAAKEAVLDGNTLKFALEKLAGKMAATTDMIIRSNTRGWKFSSVLLQNVTEKMKSEAVKCVKALELDFGAVDCCVDDKGDVYIIECNSGPGLDGSSLDAWMVALTKLVAPEPKVEPVVKVPNKAGKVMVDEAIVDLGKDVAMNKIKSTLKERNKMISDMIEAAASEEEIAVLKKVMARM